MSAPMSDIAREIRKFEKQANVPSALRVPIPPKPQITTDRGLGSDRDVSSGRVHRACSR